jgi:hypothetical protein
MAVWPLDALNLLEGEADRATPLRYCSESTPPLQATLVQGTGDDAKTFTAESESEKELVLDKEQVRVTWSLH